MKCLILAAGYATRLYPLTENFPKPLLKVTDNKNHVEKTILDWLVDDIAECRVIGEFIIISNHRYAKQFEDWCNKKRESGLAITVVDDGTETNETRLGAVKDIQFAIETLNIHDDLLVIAGDNVLDFSMESFINYAQEKQTSCIMRYYEPDDEILKNCGIVLCDKEDRILDMEEKPANPKSHWCCPPFYCYTEEDCTLIKKGIEAGCKTDAPGSFAAWLSTQVPVHAMKMPGKRYDIGDLKSYEEVKQSYQGIKGSVDNDLYFK